MSCGVCVNDYIFCINDDFVICCLFFVNQKTAYEMRISDWSSDVFSSDLCWSPTGCRAQQPVGDQPAVTLDQLHQQGEVRIFARIFGEIGRLPIHVEFT